MTVFQIKRTPTPGNSPPPLSLFEGELAVDMAEPGGPRLWVGVPPSIDPTGQRVVAGGGGFLPIDGSVPMTGALRIDAPVASLLLTSGAQSWKIEAEDAGSSAPSAFTIADAVLRRLVIEPNGQVQVFNTFTAPLIVSAFGQFVSGDFANYLACNTFEVTTSAAIRGTLILAADPMDSMEAATKQYVDTALASAAGGATISDTAPATPTPGTLWFDSANLKLCLWYDDGTSQQWITI